MLLPLTQWMLHADDLPQRLKDAPEKAAFSLPGADDLSAFADLIGGEERPSAAAQDEGVPYTLCGLLEEDIPGEVSLTREIDFGSMMGERALLVFSHLAGSGEILLGESRIARFGGGKEDLRCAYDMTGMPCQLAVDVSDALRLGRKETLCVRFDAMRPAGALDAAFLSVTQRAHLSRVSIQPDARRKTMTVRARISAQQAGRYVLRVRFVPGEKGRMPEPARETDVQLDAGQERGIQLALQVDAPAFVPGQMYAAPALKIQLFSRNIKEKGDGLLCDDALLMCGYPGAAARAYLPLSPQDCREHPQILCEKLSDLGIHAVFIGQGAPDALYRALTRAGIAAACYVSEEIRPLYTRYPCVTLLDAPPEEEKLSLQEAAWQMTGSVAFPRAVDRTMTQEEMLLEASGRQLDAGAESVRDALLWLRAVQIRLRAEAARQGRYQGALCSAREWAHDDIYAALRTAFAPVHLSALPLCGAWWTGTRFSASLEAFLPEESAGEEIQAICVLEDDDGMELSRFSAPAGRGGYLGVIEAQLPDHPCVLTLRCMLLSGERIVEESALPVYVGERGQLEAAF